MKCRITTLLLLLAGFCSCAQPSNTGNEFFIHTNGLIYADSTISQLKLIVDSLQLKFKVCPLEKPFVSIPQATGHYFSIEGRDAARALEAVKSGTTFSALTNKFPEGEAEKDLLIIRSCEDELKYTRTTFTAYNFKDRDCSINIDTNHQRHRGDLAGQWVYRYFPKTEYSEADFKAFYITTNFTSTALPLRYARMVQYVDCLVDTGTGIFFEDAIYDRMGMLYDEDSTKRTAMQQLNKYLDKHVPVMPHYEDSLTEKQYQAYRIKMEEWEIKRTTLLRYTLGTRPAFRQLLMAAFEEAKQSKQCDEEFEEIVEWHISKRASLDLKRNRRVMGFCSRDDSPRMHARQIARLSAESVNWPTFLRAHLDIMNDNVDRMMDNNYARQSRKTYIRELEQLDINTPELLLGTCLRVDNAAGKHYFGSIDRLGRALTESKQAGLVQEKMLEMIRSEDLDLYNRLTIYYLYIHYLYQQEDDKQLNQQVALLNDAIKTWPASMAARAHYVPAEK